MLNLINKNIGTVNIGILVDTLDNADIVLDNITKRLHVHYDMFSCKFIRCNEKNMCVIPVNKSLKGLHPKIWIIDRTIKEYNNEWFSVFFGNIIRDKACIVLMDIEEYK